MKLGNSMQVTLSSTTSHSTNPLIDIPLPHSRPPVPTASAVDKENKTSKKGRKGKGKEKALDVVVHPGEWTIRKALEGMEAVTIEDIEVSRDEEEYVDLRLTQGLNFFLRLTSRNLQT